MGLSIKVILQFALFKVFFFHLGGISIVFGSKLTKNVSTTSSAWQTKRWKTGRNEKYLSVRWLSTCILKLTESLAITRKPKAFYEANNVLYKGKEQFSGKIVKQLFDNTFVVWSVGLMVMGFVSSASRWYLVTTTTAFYNLFSSQSPK